MAVKRRIIAKLLLESDGETTLAVKYKRFTHDRRIVGDPVSVMRTLEDQTLDEFNITFLSRADPALVARMTATVFVPITVAGSLHTVEAVERLMGEAGVERVVVRDNTVGEAVATRWGAQAAVYPWDYHGATPLVSVPDWAGEVLLTSIDRDGTGAGYDVDAVAGYNVPVVVAGGCGKLRHVKEAFEAGASGAVVSSMFAFTDKSPIKLRSWLVSSGCNVRP